MSDTVIAKSTYFKVFAALMALLCMTYGVAFLDIGGWGTAIALGIAMTKAVLILLYFMHVRHGHRMVWITASAAFFWLAILLTLTMADYMSRGAG